MIGWYFDYDVIFSIYHFLKNGLRSDYVNLVDEDVLDQELHRRNFIDRIALLEYRFDPFCLNNFTFINTSDFVRSVRQQVYLLYPDRENQINRGLPYTPTQKVCFVLNLLGGNNFFWIGGLIGGASKSTMHAMLYDVNRQCKRIKPDGSSYANTRND